MKKGDIGSQIAALQRQLNAKGVSVEVSAIFDDPTERAVIVFQRRMGLVADGVVGPKTIAALTTGERDKKLLGEADILAAAERLDVPVAAIKAVNAVETVGHGFLPDGRPVILYERHVAFSRLEKLIGSESALIMADTTPAIINPKRGGYAGRETEWARLASARQIITARIGENTIAEESCSWGQFQVMGYHWKTLGYESFQQFSAAMHQSEAGQLDAFVRFIEEDPALAKAIRSRKWAEFARLYNGPAYKENLYDTKLARAYDAALAAEAAS